MFFLDQNFQMKNVICSLKTLVAHSYKRIIIMINFDYNNAHVVSQTISFFRQASGIERIEYADGYIGGKGTKFAKLKEEFDDVKNTSTMALVCNNHSSSGVLVGVNFDKVDSVVLVGNINETIGTQLMGRIFRPNMDRANSQFIPFVKVYSKTF